MAEEPQVTGDGEEPPKKKSKAMLFGAVGAVLIGGAAFFGIYSGMIPLGDEAAPEKDAYASSEQGARDDTYHGTDSGPVEYLPLAPIIVSLGPQARSSHLKLTVQIEVGAGKLSKVEAVLPRVNDVLNTFLRAVDETDFELPRAMMRLRAQMLRRVQLVTPEGTVRDILIQEFVLN